MLGLIERYLSGEFIRRWEDTHLDVVWFMAWIILATVVTGAILSLTTWLRERKLRPGIADDSPEVLQRRLDEAKLVLEPKERFSLRHLVSWHPAALLVLTAMSAASLWIGWHVVVLPLAAATAVSYLWHFHLRRSGVRWAATYSMASWVVPYLVVMAVIILFRPIELQASFGEGWEPDELTWRFHWRGDRVEWPHAWLYPRLNGLDPTTLTAIALWSLSTMTASLAMTLSRRLPFNPVLVVALASLVALSHWFTNPWAIPLGAFTMVLLGHAMSRERRLRISASDTLSESSVDGRSTRRADSLGTVNRFDPIVATLVVATLTIVALNYNEVVYYWPSSMLSTLELNRAWNEVIYSAMFWAPLVTGGVIGYVVFRRIVPLVQVAPYVASAILVAVLADALIEGFGYVRQLSWSDVRWPPDLDRYVSIDGWIGPRLIWPSAIGNPLALAYVIAGALLLATFWHAARGTVDDYGGLLCGATWVMVVYWIFEISVGHDGHFWYIRLNDLLLVNLTIAAIAMFAALYWGFGPGSIRTDPRQPRPRWRATAGEVR